MATAPARAHSVIVPSTFTLADRLKIQAEILRQKQYVQIGRLVTVVFEAQRSTRGLSGSRARYHNSEQQKALASQPGMHPFSEKQAVLWSSITLDWLSHKHAPIIAVSRDQQDLLLPLGLTPLPAVPDPRWVPDHARHACPNSKDGCSGCNPPRIPQLLTGCPVVGDRVRDKLKDRSGKTFGIIHPILELVVMVSGSQGGFGRIRGCVNPVDGTHLSMILDDSDPLNLQANFVGGRFVFGGS